MLESIFGKSKKSRQKTNNDDSPNDDNGYVMVVNNDPNRPPYPQTLMLNDELIRMGSSSSVIPPSSNSLYPSLDPSMPYSSGNSGNHLHVKQATCRTCSPIDNVPFSINANNNGNNNGSFDDDELEILNILNRVENFMQTTKYEFNLENSILRESI
ncbi:hypothetical protein BLA29_005831 [Euroglyphus maynei]|uniref:UMA domain-containing protein n=1 Tax=Euroglyphus maynei TaxID=6958 RepID=A0A1Y3BCD6_EURMA|nr:hypothetical protein BLA29_005831 [Euroglyphus maynei]